MVGVWSGFWIEKYEAVANLRIGELGFSIDKFLLPVGGSNASVYDVLTNKATSAPASAKLSLPG